MMIGKMERSTFNKQHNYRLVCVSDNIDLKHCGNCTHVVDGVGCNLMWQSGITGEEIKVNNRRGLCALWQRKKSD